MTFASFETRSSSEQATVARHEAIPSQAEIEREIAKLKEDSARDVQRQLEQQRLAAKRGEIKEEVEEVAEEVEDRFAPVWKAAEQGVETIVKDAEVDLKGIRRHQERVEGAEETC